MSTTPASPAPASAPQVAAATGPAGLGRAGIGLLVLSLLGGGMGMPLPVQATGPELLNIGVRARIGERRVLGEQQPESFRALDLSAQWRLPGHRAGPSDWHFGTRLIASAGLMRGAGKTALVVAATPVLVLASADGRYTIDAGLGLALLSEHRYAQQDYGGPLQASLTFGVALPLVRRLGVGYRFVHYSDAGAYGPGTIGADFHMIELIHHF